MTTSEKEYNLVCSDARSHAATVSHRRRKAQRGLRRDPPDFPHYTAKGVGMDMAPAARAKEQVLFINKDAQSECLSNSIADRRKFRDINQRRKKLRKHLDLQAHPTTGPVGWHKDFAHPDDMDHIHNQQSWTTSTSEKRTLVGVKRPMERAWTPVLRQPSQNWIDPFRATTVPIQATSYHILHYTTSRWMPVATNKINSIVGFTPVSRDDENVINRCIRRTFVYGSELDTYCGLAAAAAHMTAVDRIRIRGLASSENLTLKCLQTMRAYLSRDGDITDQLVYNIFNLSMAEYYTGNVAACQIHWQNMKRSVKELGGFPSLAPYIGWFCISADFLLAATSLTIPVFNFLDDSALMGVCLPSNASEPNRVAFATGLEPRVRTSISNNISLSNSIALIRLHHAEDLSAIAGCLQQRTASIGYTLMACALEFEPESVAKRKDVGGKTDRTITDAVALCADALVCRARGLAFCIWLWHTARYVSLSDAEMYRTSFERGADLMCRHAEELHSCLNDTEAMLAETLWSVKPHILLWIRLLGITTWETKASKQNLYHEKIQKLLTRLHLRHYKDIVNFLDPLLSLEYVPSNSLLGFEFPSRTSKY